jgi:hypothetical protein
VAWWGKEASEEAACPTAGELQCDMPTSTVGGSNQGEQPIMLSTCLTCLYEVHKVASG